MYYKSFYSNQLNSGEDKSKWLIIWVNLGIVCWDLKLLTIFKVYIITICDLWVWWMLGLWLSYEYKIINLIQELVKLKIFGCKKDLKNPRQFFYTSMNNNHVWA
jgi:hypothetical protein